MKQLRAIVLYVLAIVVLGALLAPWLYWGGSLLTKMGWLGTYPFHRYFNRAVTIVAFIGLWPFVRAFGIRRWADVGLKRRSAGWMEFGAGTGVGVASIALLAAAAVLTGAQHWKSGLSVGAIAGALASALAAGLVVGLLEELFFRGMIYGALRRIVEIPPALIVSSVFYSIVHFTKGTGTPQNYSVTWLSGFDVLWNSTHLSIVWPFFITLVLAGWMLAWAFEKTGALYLSIGLHAGWVFALQLNPKLFEGTQKATAWFGNGTLENGWLCVPLLLVVFAAVAWNLRRRSA